MRRVIGDPGVRATRSIDAQNLMTSASGAILSISHTVRRVYLRITLARWRAKMLPRCSDLLASTAKASFTLAPETAANALRKNNQSLEVFWGGKVVASMLLCTEQEHS